MSANDGETRLMAAVEDSDPSEIIPAHTSEHTVGYVDPQPTPPPAYLTMPALPLPASPFLNPLEAPGFQEFCQKWLADVVPMVEQKAREYGSNSLEQKGHRYARAQGRGAKQQEALELGVMQYVAEKLDRIEDAALRQLPASADTWQDLVVYGLMGLYIRSYGRWL